MNKNNIIELTRISYIKGYTQQIKQPSILIDLQVTKGHERIKKNIIPFDRKMKSLFTLYNLENDEIDNLKLLQRLYSLHSFINTQAKVPIFSKPHIQILKDNQYYLFLPILGDDISYQKELFLLLLNELNNKQQNFKKEVKRIHQALFNISPKGENQPRFLKIAYDSNMVYHQVYGNTYSYGYGKHRRYLDSSVTDETSSIAMMLARNKMATKKILKQAGLPVLDIFILNSLEDAKQKAKKIGYPVVIKPIDLDGGKGVTAWIQNEQMLIRAYNEAKKVSKNIGIEKHFTGDDLRVNVCNGEIYYAIKRTPPQIKGNNKDTIRDLIQKLNHKKKLEQKQYNYIKPITIDDELIELLKYQNYTLESIPKMNQNIRLGTTANVSRGGDSQDLLNINVIHPDNIELAKRVVSVLKIDIAGVDFLISDITRSYKEIGAVITEVNGKPQHTFYDSFKHLLFKIVKNNGEIPTIVVLGKYNSKIIKKITNTLKTKNTNIGIVSKEGIYKNNSLLTQNKYNNLYDATEVVMSDSSIDSILLFIDDVKFLSSGYPIKNANLIVTLENNSQNLLKNITSYFDTTPIVKYLSQEYKNLIQKAF